jgi:hypothetical protein
MATQLEHHEFAAALNTRFKFITDGEKAEEFELVEISELLESARQSRFSIMFRGPGDLVMRQGLRRFESERLGQLDLFIVPISKDEKGVYYEAVFNRLKPTE